MKPFRSLALGLVGASLTAGAVFAGGHGAETPASVTARQAQMQLYAFNLGILGAMAQGKADYDADAATAAAANIITIAGLVPEPMWPPGTSADDVEASRALPVMWQSFDDVVVKAIAMNEAAAAMQAAAGTSLEALQGAMGALGAACGACHKAYRAPE